MADNYYTSTFLPIKKNLRTKELSLAVPGLLSDAYAAYTAPSRALQGQIDTTSPQGLLEANNFALNFVGGGSLPSITKPMEKGVLGVLKVPPLQEKAKSYFGTTSFPAETGYLMDDLSRLDLSGRHQAGGYQQIANRNIPLAGKPDYLKLQRSIDHRDLGELVGPGGGWERMSEFMDKTGAVRYDINSGVSLVNKNKPSDAQINQIVRDFKSRNTPLTIDVDRMSDGGNLASKEFKDPTFNEVKSWIDRQYKTYGNK